MYYLKLDADDYGSHNSSMKYMPKSFQWIRTTVRLKILSHITKHIQQAIKIHVLIFFNLNEQLKIHVEFGDKADDPDYFPLTATCILDNQSDAHKRDRRRQNPRCNKNPLNSDLIKNNGFYVITHGTHYISQYLSYLT